MRFCHQILLLRQTEPLPGSPADAADMEEALHIPGDILEEGERTLVEGVLLSAGDWPLVEGIHLVGGRHLVVGMHLVAGMHLVHEDVQIVEPMHLAAGSDIHLAASTL